MSDFRPLLYTYAKSFTQAIVNSHHVCGSVFLSEDKIAEIQGSCDPFGTVFLSEETAAKSIGLSVDRLRYWSEAGHIKYRYLFTPLETKAKQTTMKIYSMNELQQFERLSHHS